MTITDKLAEAIELAEDAMAYVPEYFANKHGMNRRMAALKEDSASPQAAPAPAVQGEPYCHVYEHDSPLGLHRALYPKQWNGKQPDRAIPVYTHPSPQAQAAIAEFCRINGIPAPQAQEGHDAR